MKALSKSDDHPEQEVVTPQAVQDVFNAQPLEEPAEKMEEQPDQPSCVSVAPPSRFFGVTTLADLGKAIKLSLPLANVAQPALKQFP